MGGLLAKPSLSGLLGNALQRQPTPTWNALSGRPRMEEVLTLPPKAAYNTALSPQEELAYRMWMVAIGHTPERGFAVDNNYTGENYDYRGYFKKHGPVKLGETEHLTDEFKLPTHPSFSNESQYAKGQGAPFAGSWRGEEYTPSIANYIRSLRKR